MITKMLRVRETRLFSYVIASADMHYSAVGERTIYLRNDPDVGPVVRGEICDLGPGCYTNLSQVLLEYAMSCEGCQECGEAAEMMECTGERLGKILAAKLYQDAPELPVVDRVCGAFDFILQSMEMQFEREIAPNRVHYDLGCCPLLETAQRTGFMAGLVTARLGFVVLCSSMLTTLAPAWSMARPTIGEIDESLVEIVLHY